MQRARYINPRGESIYFDIKPPFILQRIEGTGNVEVNIQSQKSPYQDGNTFIDAKLESRDLFMQVTILASTQQELFKMRQDLQKVFNPKLGQGQLIYETPNGAKMINCIVDGTPLFSNYINNKVSCQINLLASDPFWYDINDLQVESKLPYISNFSFPLSSPNYEMGILAEDTVIINRGTAYTPLNITIGTTSGVKIINHETNEFINVVKPILADEKLVINTKLGERKVTLIKADGTEVNGFSYLSLDSTFFQLLEGNNIISYIPKDNSEDTLVNIKWKNRYIGL